MSSIALDVRGIDGVDEIKHNATAFFEQVAQEGLALIQTYLPQAQPHEDTLLFINSAQLEGASYYDKIRGRHLIKLNIPFFRLLPNERNLFQTPDLADVEIYSLAFAHELIHQKNAEINGIRSIYGFCLDDYITDQSFNNLTPDQYLRSALDCVPKEFLNNINENGRSLASILDEGIATQASLYIANRRIADLKKIDSVENLRRIKGARSDKDIALRSILRGRTIKVLHQRHYFEGASLVKQLFDIYGLEKLANVLRSIDVEACRNICQRSDNYQLILKDPTKIPGIHVIS